MAEPNFVPLATYREYPVEEMKDRAAEFEAEIRRGAPFASSQSARFPEKLSKIACARPGRRRTALTFSRGTSWSSATLH